MPSLQTLTHSNASSSSSCLPLYAQCGDGVNYTGPTNCCSSVRPAECRRESDSFSRCVPKPVNTPVDTVPPSDTPEKDNSTSVFHSAGITTRYWDCCKPSCAWPGKALVSNPVKVCAADGVTPLDPQTPSSCNGGSAYSCNDNQPWIGNDTYAMAFAAAALAGRTEAQNCCSCFKLSFKDPILSRKTLIVQVTNTGADLIQGKNHFDIQIPGGGFGYFDACTGQWGGQYRWGERYGGVNSREECANLPAPLHSGCQWRFDWFGDNPEVEFDEVTCPEELVSRSGCRRL